MNPPPTSSDPIARTVDELASLAGEKGAFARVVCEPAAIECRALTNDEASYRVAHENGQWSVAWLSANRYLSQSIEADLMWTGDKIEELIDEELADQGYTGPELGKVEHFRDQDKRFTFIVRLGASVAAADLFRCLLAFDLAFSQLGDMKPDEE